MKKEHEKRLDILDSIDDDIIEKHTKKRYALLSGKAPKQNKPRFVLAVAACLALLVVASSFLILPRLWHDDSKQIPVYQGMTISSEKQTETADLGELEYATLSLDSWYANSGRMTLFDKDDNNGNHFGQNKKPIEDLAEDSLKVEGSAEKIYYAEPNQDIYITIHVSNPDNFEILSFTLNEKKYSSYMFEEGSDMENLILKVNVGDVEGMVEYTIDAIKYIDGTEIKDVVMAGDKTVQCGIYSDKQPTAEVMSEVIGINKLTFTANITDPLNLIAERGGKAVAILSNGNELIAEQPLTLGENNTVVFENLLTDSDYEYAIVAIYDSLNGDGIVPIVLYSRVIHTHGVVAFDSVTVTQSGVTFSYVWNDAFENKVLTSAILYKGEEKVQELALDATSIDGLLSDNAYSIVITYENMGKTESVTLDFTTKAKTVPTLSIEQGDVKQESFGFGITYTDPDSVGAVTKIELLHGEDEPIVAESVDAREFAHLLSDNEYTLRVTVTYDLNDGTGEHSFSETLAGKTKAKTVPTVTFSEMKVTKYALTGRYDITDLHGVLLDKTVELYQGENVVATTTSEGELSFSDLDDYTDYTIKISYTYDLNDGKGEQSGEKSHSIKTLPHVDVTSVSVRNTATLFEGDTILLQVNLDNPHNGKVTAVTVNQTSYAVTAPSSQSVFAEIVVGNQFGAGTVALTVEAVTLTVDGKSYTVACDTLMSDEIFVNGKFEYIEWDFVNAAHEPVYVLIPGEETYFRIKLNNPTDYAIDSVTIHNQVLKGEDLIRIDQNTYLSPVTFVLNEDSDGAENAGSFVMMYGDGSEHQNVQLHFLTYGNEYVNNTSADGDDHPLPVYVLRSNEIRKISSVEDLYSMDEHIRYELTCDLDLSGIEWKGVPFCGILNGNGYAIKNMSMSFVGTIKEPVKLGLFSEAIGLIENLHIENATTVATVTDTSVIYGSIAANAGYTLGVKNCTVNAASMVTIIGTGSIGGIVGRGSENTVIQNCTNHSNIMSNISLHVGGIVGMSEGSVIDCMNTGEVSGNEFVGGIVGYNYGSVTGCSNSGDMSGVSVGGIAGRNNESKGGLVTDCSNSGVIKGSGESGYAGGILGRNGGTVSNCINRGDVISGNKIGGIVGQQLSGTISDCINIGYVIDGTYIGGVVGEFLGNSIISNCYATILYKTPMGKLVTLETLAEKSFWTDTLGWDEAVWIFDDLDPSSGKYPTLRNIE